jgi:hypothetical protein
VSDATGIPLPEQAVGNATISFNELNSEVVTNGR